MKKSIRTLLTALLAIILLGGGVFAGMHWQELTGKRAQETETETTAEVDESADDWTGAQEVYTGKKNTDTIDIPGFDMMYLKAGTTEQQVNLYNPEQNSCYFKMSILLDDGTQLWQSKLIEPGKGIYEVTLSQALEAGAYENAVLKYECFAMDEAQTPLNGSEIRFTIKAVE